MFYHVKIACYQYDIFSFFIILCFLEFLINLISIFLNKYKGDITFFSNSSRMFDIRASVLSPTSRSRFNHVGHNFNYLI